METFEAGGYEDDESHVDFNETASIKEEHRRTIIHIDIDCFYAQVEMLNQPALRDKPLGVQQKNIVVTCNYVARQRGVGKCQYVTDALAVCPELQLVNGEDLAQYRRVSMAVYNTLVRETGAEVERLGMDENWIDVSSLVATRLRQEKGIVNIRQQERQPLENVDGLECCDSSCDCQERLYVGGMIAMELRSKVRQEHGLTVSAGVCYNKLLAKLAGGLNKPNNQTVLGPAAIDKVIKANMKVTSIPGIGRKMGETLESAKIVSVADLRAANIEDLVNAGLPPDNANIIQMLSHGKDNSAVKMSGKVGSIGLEDRFIGIYDKVGVREKLTWLVDRLEQLILEDGRQATTFRVTVRDYFKDKQVKKFHKESRQSQVSPRLFALDQGSLRPSSKLELIDIGVSLVGKMVNMSSNFQLTLLGVSVTDFIDQVESKASIKRFFSPIKNAIEVSSNRISPPSASLSTSPVVCGKKPDISKFFNNNASTSKSQKRKLSFDEESKPATSHQTEEKLICPSDYDKSVWDSLPPDLQREILSESSRESEAKTMDCRGSLNEDCPSWVDPNIFSQLPEDIRQEIVSNTKRKSPPGKKNRKNDIKNYFKVQQAEK